MPMVQAWSTTQVGGTDGVVRLNAGAAPEFVREVLAFIDRHWPDKTATSAAARQAWFGALRDAARTAPAWPREFGGTGWSAPQLLFWHRATAWAGVPVFDPVGVELAGPLLIAARVGAAPALRARIDAELGAIREGRSIWNHALGRYPQPTLCDPGAEPSLEGRSGPLTGTAGAHRLLLLAGAFDPQTLVFIDASAPGVSIETDAAGTRRAVCAAARGWAIGPIDAARALIALGPPRAVTLRRKLAALERMLALVADGYGDVLARDRQLSRRSAAAAVRLAALEGLEERIAATAGPDADPRRAVCVLLGARLREELPALAAAVLGHHVLPAPRSACRPPWAAPARASRRGSGRRCCAVSSAPTARRRG
jgi:hypothetical protein